MATSSMISQPEEYFSKEGTVSVNIACERCSMPLSMPNDLNNSLFSQKTGLSCQNAEEDDDIVFIENFQMLTGSLDSGISRNQAYDYAAKRDILRPLFSKSSDLGKLNIELLGLTSGFPKVDHPLCQDCADNILDNVDQELKVDEDDIEEYRQLLLRLEMEDEEEDVDELKKELQKYGEIEARLQEELSVMETEKNQIKELVRGLERYCDILEEEMNEMCPRRQYLLFKDDLCSFQNQITYVKNRCDKLNKTDAFRLAFQILCNNDIGIINGYRLGRLPNTLVTWSEINAAWGQTVLLLHSLSKLINFTLENLQLVPMSNRSYVKLVVNNEVKLLPLFYFGDENKRIKLIEFDQGMAGFLNYLQKFKEAIEEEDTIRLPYPIQRSKIIDGRNGNAYSVKLQLNTEENWTRALKSMLTNLRWALAWSSKIIAK